MSRLTTWFVLVASIVAYRWIVTDTTLTLEEHAAGIYFSGLALLLHWTTSRDVMRNRSEK